MTRQQEIKEEMQRVWCQHCKAMQKTNNTVVECLYNPLDHGREKAFCASNEDAVNAILKAESDRGAVIKVERELPKNPYPKYCESMTEMPNICHILYPIAQKDMLKADFGAFESIIEKGGDDAKTEC